MNRKNNYFYNSKKDIIPEKIHFGGAQGTPITTEHPKT